MRKRTLIATVALGFAAFAAAAPAFAADVTITAKNFSFSPKVVTLKKGQTTTLHIKSAEGVHGLNVPGIGLPMTTITAAGTDVKVTPKKAGTFDAHCAIVCGAGHEQMAMKFVVK